MARKNSRVQIFESSSDDEEEVEEPQWMVKNTFIQFDLPEPAGIQYSKSTPAACHLSTSKDLAPLTTIPSTKEDAESIDDVTTDGVFQYDGSPSQATTERSRKKAMREDPVRRRQGKGKGGKYKQSETIHGNRWGDGYSGDYRGDYSAQQYGHDANYGEYYAAAAAAAANAVAANYYYGGTPDGYGMPQQLMPAYGDSFYPSPSRGENRRKGGKEGWQQKQVDHTKGAGKSKPGKGAAGKGTAGKGAAVAGFPATSTAKKVADENQTRGQKAPVPEAANPPEVGGAKYQCTFWIGIADSTLDLAMKILGPRGKTFKHIGNVARGTRLRLRGAGSSTNAPSEEPLHLRIISSQLVNFNIAKEKVTELLQQIYAQHEKETGEKVTINCVDSPHNPTTSR